MRVYGVRSGAPHLRGVVSFASAGAVATAARTVRRAARVGAARRLTVVEMMEVDISLFFFSARDSRKDDRARNGS